jgi:hypothetical protein
MDDPQCRAVEECGTVIYCQETAVNCLAIPVCNSDENQVDACENDDPKCRTLEECGTVIYCQEAEPVQCDAIPVCQPSQRAVDTPCIRGDLNCTVVEECGTTIYCVPEVQCTALGACISGEYGTQIACEANERDTCSEQGICGQVLFCRPDENCRAIPTCDNNSTQSNDPCLSTESVEECQAVSLCGSTITCRSNR